MINYLVQERREPLEPVHVPNSFQHAAHKNFDFPCVWVDDSLLAVGLVGKQTERLSEFFFGD